MAHAADLPAAAAAAPVAGEVTFEELCERRFAATQAAGHPGDGEYRRVRTQFEATEGKIAQEWWSQTAPAGAVLTTPATSAVRTVVGAQTGAKLHRWTDRLTFKYPEIAGALHEADGLAVRCGEILRGTAQRVALVHVLAAMVSLLGYVEVMQHAASSTEETATTNRGLPTELERYRNQLVASDQYYRQAAARATQIFYFWGMIVGVLVIAVLTTVVAITVTFLLEWSGIGTDAKTFSLMITAVSAGGLGACISAMWRISSGTFKADYEAGSTHARIIGSFRPFIGAIFGLALYVALRAGFLPRFQADSTDFYLAAMIAFLGGFSERLAPDVFAKAENDVSSSDDEKAA